MRIVFPKRVLVTGASGFVASALISGLLKQNLEVVGLVRQDLPDWPWPDVERIQCDLTKSAVKIEQVVKFARPNAVIHLAATTPPGHEGANQWKVLEENSHSTEQLLKACAKVTPKPTVLVSSSGAVYGPGKPRTLFSERSSYRPVTHYGVSKVVGEMLATRAMREGLPTIRARMFNVVGPGQKPNFVISAFAKQIVQIEAGLCRPEMKVTSLAPTRDFVDVRDVATGLLLLLGRGRKGAVYNICSGRSVQIKQALRLLFSMSRCANEIQVMERSGFIDQIPYHCGSAEKINRIGWRPRYKLKQTLSDCLEFWRSKV